MAQSLTRSVVNQVSDLYGKKGTVFNDRMKDGRRSVKVWGWGEKEFQAAADKLRALGCDVEIVVTPVLSGSNARYGQIGGEIRMRVREN